jgi:hypothetical protein
MLNIQEWIKHENHFLRILVVLNYGRKYLVTMRFDLQVKSGIWTNEIHIIIDDFTMESWFSEELLILSISISGNGGEKR